MNHLLGYETSAIVTIADYLIEDMKSSSILLGLAALGAAAGAGGAAAFFASRLANKGKVAESKEDRKSVV